MTDVHDWDLEHCPSCGTLLDTGYECGECGYDAQWIAAVWFMPDNRASIAQPVPVSEPIGSVATVFNHMWVNNPRIHSAEDAIKSMRDSLSEEAKKTDSCYTCYTDQAADIARQLTTILDAIATPPQAVVAQPVKGMIGCAECTDEPECAWHQICIRKQAAQSPQAKAVETPPCKGMNCGCTDGASHSPECQAEHAAAVAGGSFVKVKSFPPMTYEDWAHGEDRCQSCKLNGDPNCPHNSQAKAGDKS